MKTRFIVFLLSTLVVLAVPARAIERALIIAAPATVFAGGDVHVDITASTTARDAEQIGFFQAEYSSDGGKTWVPVYAERLGKTTTRGVDFKAGAEGTSALVRVRVAFRGGVAGDVDFAGRPIAWGGSWSSWETPPTKRASVTVVPK